MIVPNLPLFRANKQLNKCKTGGQKYMARAFRDSNTDKYSFFPNIALLKAILKNVSCCLAFANSISLLFLFRQELLFIENQSVYWASGHRSSSRFCRWLAGKRCMQIGVCVPIFCLFVRIGGLSSVRIAFLLQRGRVE